jgi:ribonuclease HII
MKPIPSFEFEKAAGFESRMVAGVDEVGRGCLAGPVVAAAVILPPFFFARPPGWLSEVTDSKQISAEVRFRLSALIRAESLAWSLGEASVEEIDSINIHHASHLAMIRAVESLSKKVDWILVDGKFVPKKWSRISNAIIKGDSRSYSIACASILAKVFRDEMLEKMDLEYPGYGLADHKGYSTPRHKERLKALGPAIIHRKSFAPVKELLIKTDPTARSGTVGNSWGALFESTE